MDTEESLYCGLGNEKYADDIWMGIVTFAVLMSIIAGTALGIYLSYLFQSGWEKINLKYKKLRYLLTH